MAYTNIDDPSAFFQTATYTGNGSNPRNLTNDGNSDLKPDFLWLKNRTDNSTDHVLANSSIGWDAPKGQGYAWENGPFGGQMASNSTGAESTPAATYGYISAALTDGFTAAAGGTNGDTVNKNNKEFVAWQWKANGGTTASNSDGNITSTVQANTTAGFSIVTWTGNENSSASVGHGLGVTPEMVFFKRRNTTYNWVIYLGALGQVSGNNMFAYLNLTNAAEQAAGITFTSSLLNPGSGATTNSGNMIAYCFNSVQGYSKFGKYEGNSNANGPFIYTGFKPAFVMLKPADISEHWVMHDGTRDPVNKTYHYVFANESEAEASGGTHHIDLLSNGFKIRTSNNNWNTSSTVIYMAFAENPFVTSTGIPTTAR